MKRDFNGKKVLILCGAELEKAPYVLPYIELLKQNSVPFDVLCQKSQMAVDVAGENVIGFGNKYDANAPGWKKFLMMLEQARIAKRVIRKNGYSKVIVFTAQKGLFLSWFLKKNYSRQYVLDIRDHTPLLRIPFCNKLLKSVIDNSAYTVISSAGFKRWLPESDKYIVCHNTSFEMIEYGLCDKIEKERGKHESSQVTKLLTIGQIRDTEANAAVIDAIQTDKHLEMYFVGSGNSVPSLESHCRDQNSERVTFAGRYHKKDEQSIVEQYDMINSYMNHGINSDSLLTNRLYLSAILRKPILVRKGTFQAELVKHYGLGLAVESVDTLSSDIKCYLENIDMSRYDSNCKRFLNDVKAENRQWESSILSFVNG